ncbi:type II toxin-antitoxin system death-on-curing family toxin [Ligilactobacillus saerimneri]|uniref:type II toxin-antitoxin system death-on-curing family toxin n=1 Tax=Ligilactobacillus saerimneri TaxID=228229 RepID=UPI0029428B6A|nr:type II toxin-antitoxin system death-on-curing family toxin [Ligilactobacillus saerimneri]
MAEELDGALVIPEINDAKQREEFSKVFARTLNLDKVSKDEWAFQIKEYSTDTYVLRLIVDDMELGAWIILNTDFTRLSIFDLKTINRKAEKMFREEWFYGIKDKEGLESLLARVDNGFFGIKPYATTLSKAKVIWFTIATKQMFNNGNKRTALLATITFLGANGYKLINKTANDLYEVSLNLANKTMSEEELYQYLLKNTVIDFNKMDNLFLKKVFEDIKEGE